MAQALAACRVPSRFECRSTHQTKCHPPLAIAKRFQRPQRPRPSRYSRQHCDLQSVEAMQTAIATDAGQDSVNRAFRRSRWQARLQELPAQMYAPAGELIADRCAVRDCPLSAIPGNSNPVAQFADLGAQCSPPCRKRHCLTSTGQSDRDFLSGAGRLLQPRVILIEHIPLLRALPREARAARGTGSKR